MSTLDCPQFGQKLPTNFVSQFWQTCTSPSFELFIVSEVDESSIVLELSIGFEVSIIFKLFTESEFSI